MQDILVGLIGRPILILIKILRWWWMPVAVVAPISGIIQMNIILSLIIGLALTSIGITISRYDQVYKDYVIPEVKQ